MKSDISSKASICAIVHLEIIDFSKKTDSEQAEIKSQLNNLINHAVIDIAHNNRAILNVANGAVIACIGALEDALEDALLISLTIRDEILESNNLNTTPFYLRFGINLGSAQLSSDVNGKPSIVGESIDQAQRIMSFAKPNQILVSRPYYEMTSKLSQEISQMFEYHDMHANEQDIYAVRALKEPAAIEESPPITIDHSAQDVSAPEKEQSTNSEINWNYVLLGLLVFVAFFALIKLVSTPTEPTITLAQPALKEPPAKAIANLPAKSAEDLLLPNESLETSPPQARSDEDKPVEDELVEKKLTEIMPVQKIVEHKTDQKKVNKMTAQKKARPKPVAETKANIPTNTETKPDVSKIDKAPEKEKSAEKDKFGWGAFRDSVKQGTDRQCSQAEIAMNQCR